MFLATPLVENLSVASAPVTSLPRMRSSTSPAFCAEVRTLREVAVACTIVVPLLPGLLGLQGVPLEGPRRGELAELVTDHVLGHVHRHELLAVVHRERVADHLGDHRRPARPGLDDLLL